jgi:hypothetical protein
MDSDQKKKLTFIVVTFAIIVIFAFLVKLGMTLFLKDFDYFRAF